MSGAGLAALRRLIAERYDALRNQVSRRLGGAPTWPATRCTTPICACPRATTWTACAIRRPTWSTPPCTRPSTASARTPACSARARSANSSSWRTRPRPGRDRPVAFGHARHVQGAGHADAAPARHPGGGARRRLVAARTGATLGHFAAAGRTRTADRARALPARDAAGAGRRHARPAARRTGPARTASEEIMQASVYFARLACRFAVAQTSKQENGASARAARTRP